MFRSILRFAFLTSPFLGLLLFLLLLDVLPNTTEGIVCSLIAAAILATVLALVGFSSFASRPTVLPKDN